MNSGAKGRRFEVRSVAWTSKQINIIFCQMGVTAACGSISPYNTAHDLCNWLLSAHATTVLTPRLSPHPWSAYRVLFACRSLLAEWFWVFFPRLLQWTSWSSDTCVVHPSLRAWSHDQLQRHQWFCAWVCIKSWREESTCAIISTFCHFTLNSAISWHHS